MEKLRFARGEVEDTLRVFAELFALSMNVPDLGRGDEGALVLMDKSSDLGHRAPLTTVLSHDAAVWVQLTWQQNLDVCAWGDHTRENSWLTHPLYYYNIQWSCLHVWVKRYCLSNDLWLYLQASVSHKWWYLTRLLGFSEDQCRYQLFWV